MGPRRQVAGALFLLLALTAAMVAIGEGWIVLPR